MDRIKKVLIANRGEIAVRIIRACKELGLETVQVYSEADRDSLAVELADHAVCIGPAKSSESYLNTKAIIGAALTNGVDAIHPGYGYLSENADFAELCREQNIIFIGPEPEVINLMGDKAVARQTADKAGVPTTPGSSAPVNSLEEVEKVVKEIGYPIILKASAGGGGKGMRVVFEASELKESFESAKREAKSAFSDDAVYIEKFLTNIRHIEVQVLADSQTVLHLGERDCTIQRRNQKLVEESPSPVLSDELREKICQSAVALAENVGYTNAGTVEFILDQETNEFYFMEMNTRIQVEHPVTEMITGVDLVKEQISIEMGNPLHLRQKDIKPLGHAIECRVNAEDPDRDFMPSPGTITRYVPSGGTGVRLDSHLYTGYSVPPYYDSLLGKLIVWGLTREEALQRMTRATEDIMVEGVPTTLPFYQKLLKHEDFIRGEFNTGFIQEKMTKNHIPT